MATKILVPTLRRVRTFVTAHTFCSSGPSNSGFVTAVPDETQIYLSGLQLRGKSRSWLGLLESEKKIRGNHAFFRDK